MANERPTEGSCIFCKIVAGDIPCLTIYEDADVLSFLDIGPLSLGHALVIPKGHWVTLDGMPGQVAGACLQVVPRISQAILKATGATAWNLLQNNGKAAHQEVGHVHFHIIPKTGQGGLGIGWKPGELGKPGAGEQGDGSTLVNAIKAQL